MIHNAVFLTDENSALHIINQRQQYKHSKFISFISQKGILIIQERLVHTQSVENIKNEEKEQSVNKSKHHISSKCSLCSSLKHTVYTCAQCYSNN